MTSQAETVELLVKKANFQPLVALAVAEAIDGAMRDSQFVTVPILDARVADLRADTQAILSRLENKIDVTQASLSKEIDVTREKFSKDIDVTKAGLSKEIEVRTERVSKEIFAIKAELVRWVLLAMLGSTAIGAGVVAVDHEIHQGR